MMNRQVVPPTTVGVEGEDNLGKWLNLKLGRNEPSMTEDSDSLSKPQQGLLLQFLHEKVLQFPSIPQEGARSSKKVPVSEGSAINDGLPLSSPMVRSLGVRPHSLVHKPSNEGTRMGARFNDTNKGFMAWTQLMQLEEGMDLMWPGSFHVDPQTPKQPPELLKLDLNLRL